MWLSGFFPIALLQGLVIIFGMYFASDTLGYFGFAVLVVANMAMFKDVSLSLYLPKLIHRYSTKKILDKALLARAILFGLVPVLVMLICIFLMQSTLQRVLPEKLSQDVFTFIYILGFSQIFMAMYQPIFRLLSALGFHTRVLIISLVLLACLLSLYVLFGTMGNPYYMAASSGIVSFMALLISLKMLNQITVLLND
ncbi:hypothetical protein Q4567_15845 [Aliiglaciecola sp. 2_MG-2023]|uniref:hypothetical protein n=1 Tax=unclassified Aliiglaciecola TaxID=2593648 RepID=UPI0026E233DF|nr:MULTISPECIES: hypothetical protein [unclassified Aliiglaciecola]MDO6712208.1 hypothetical protein [Aliiglaciecola sp. 2_MG-2023]MDO6753554.1 hypothetical protein [Aliiglaciecola sp. 1_MG-2023]